MKALVTGATGFVGSHLVRRLLLERVSVHLTVRPGANLWRLTDCQGELTRHEAELRDQVAVAKVVSLVQPELVFHLAASGMHAGLSASPSDLVAINVGGLVSLIDALRAHPPRMLVCTGSSSEYGHRTTPMREDELCAPMDAYGFSKLSATLYAQLAHRAWGLPTVVVRPFSPFGPLDDARRVISQTVLRLARGQALSLGDPNAVRDYIYIDDLIELLWRVAQRPELAGMILNAGSGTQRRTRDVVGAIVLHMNATAELRWGTYRGARLEPACWQADMTTTAQSLGPWQPTDFHSALGLTLDWFARHTDLYP